MSQSNYVRIWIEVGARRYPLAQAAPDWVELAGEDTATRGARRGRHRIGRQHLPR